MNTKQTRMFQYEDLPLFSGAAPRVPDETFDPQPEPRQATWARCRLCRDTGEADGKPCWCAAGDQVKNRQRRQRVLEDARTLASGTLATLTNLTGYTDLDLVRERFIRFVADNLGLFETWQEAWASFWPRENQR